MRRASVTAMVAVAAVTAAATATAADWPQFLGPNGDGTSPETGLLAKWPADGPPMRWEVKVGPGYGGAAVRDGEVFILDRKMGEADVLRCFDLDTGEEKWSHEYEAQGRTGFPGSRCTPAVTEQHVVTVGPFGHVTCVSRQTHKPVWQTNVRVAYKPSNLPWGYGQSALVHDGRVIVMTNEASTPGMVAFDLASGELAWESEPFGGDKQYCTPVIRTVLDREGVVARTGGAVYFIDPANGETIWKYDAFGGRSPIPVVTVLPDGEHVFVTNGYNNGSVMLRVSKGGPHEFERKFRLSEGAQIHPALYVDGYLYSNINENANLRGRANRAKGGLACINTGTGEIEWRTGAEPELDRGGLILADGRIIMLGGQDGTLYLIKPNPERFEVISKFTALPQERSRNNNIWAVPALSDGRLIVRDQNVMRCFDLRSK